MKSFFLILLKIFVLLAITAIGAGITCGGNLLLIGYLDGTEGTNEVVWMIFWGIEIFTVFCLATWFLFFRKPKPGKTLDTVSEGTNGEYQDNEADIHEFEQKYRNNF